MGLITRKQLLEKDDFQIEKVDLGKKGHVFVREMTGAERDHFEASILKKVQNGNTTSYEQDFENLRAKLAVLCVCDQDGKRILKDTDWLPLGLSLGYRSIDKIVDKARELNGIDEAAKKEIQKK